MSVRNLVGVVIVIDDCDFVVVEVLPRPGNRQESKHAEVDVIVGIWGEDVVLPGTCALAVPWGSLPKSLRVRSISRHQSKGS